MDQFIQQLPMSICKVCKECINNTPEMDQRLQPWSLPAALAVSQHTRQQHQLKQLLQQLMCPWMRLLLPG